MSEVQQARSQTDTRILKLLGSGTTPSLVASACGVSESYISQLLSDDDFKSEVLNLKFQSLSAHNERDLTYDELEDRITKQLSRNLSLIQKPGELLNALRVVNGLKRRGTNSADANATQASQVVTLNIPTSVVQHFTMNINNQVIQTGSQTLETMQSSTLLSKARNKLQEVQNERPLQISQNSGGSENEILIPTGITDPIEQAKSNADSTEAL